MEGLFAVDPSKEPKRIDMTRTDRQNEGNDSTVFAVYKLEGDTLTVCYGVGSRNRPSDLKPGEDRSVIIYKRKKP
jgi:uncharacterized protein (TIGR03067 family)